MGMHLSARVSMSIGPFTRICKELYLPAPKVDEEKCCAVVTEELYEFYRKVAELILDRAKESRGMSIQEYHFLLCCNILNNARVEWLCEHDSNQEMKWGDLYFG